MRTYQHVIDTNAIKRVLDILPDHWVIRELTERDYGIDLLVEIFEEIRKDKHGHSIYDSTGTIFHIQVKGTTKPLKQNSKSQKFAVQLPKKTILYAEHFSDPFFLFRVDLSTVDAPSYFLWIQRYARDVLEAEVPDWRTNNRESVVVYIPPHNQLSGEVYIDKIEKIAARPRLFQELVDFRESYFHLESQLDHASAGNFAINESSLAHLVFLAKQISNLRLKYKYNNSCVTKQHAEDLLSFVQSLRPNNETRAFAEFPHRSNFKLLANSIEGLHEIENLLAISSLETVY